MDSTEKNSDMQLLNPCLVVRLNVKLFHDHDTTFAKEDWVKANDILIARDGSEAWLRTFLETLSGSFRESLASPVNPYHAVVIARLGDTAKSATSSEWLADNARLIGEVGASRWLWAMIELLERGDARRPL